MKIKDVETLVGMSTHSIRFYEEMGLITIRRRPESKYRDFSEEDVNKLKEIKLFRSLGIPMEEIRRYYAHEISLQEIMDHQMKELELQHEELQLKEKLCEDIKKSNVPLISYTVKQYDDIIQHKREKTPFQEAGSLISVWNQQRMSKKRLIFIEILTFPLLWIFTSWIIFFLASLPHILHVGAWEIQYEWYSFVIATILTFIISWSDYCISTKLPNELYEFRENGIYYYRKESKKRYLALLHAARKNRIEDCFSFVSYQDIRTFKVWFHIVAKTPINGGNVYQIDFYIFTKNDQIIRINTGMIGVTDEKIRLTAEILREYADKIMDPFHILDHLDLDRYQFYAYLDEICLRKEQIKHHKSTPYTNKI